MNLGFVGTGEITSAIVTGLCASDFDLRFIRVSPRNREIAETLAHRFRGVSIASSNQDVLDSCEVVVIAVRPPIARSVLSDLRFDSGHRVISVVSALSLASLSELAAPATRIARAVPLPSTAKRIGPTAIYPPDSQAEALFAAIGTVFAVDTEVAFDAICATTATIACTYAFIETIASWLVSNGVQEEKARDYLARMFLGVTSAAVDSPERSFQELAAAHATSGGINEQFLRHLVEHGFLKRVSDGLDAVRQRIERQARSTEGGSSR